MTPYVLAPAGGAVDVCWHQGRLYAAWQHWSTVEVGVYGRDGRPLGERVSVPCSDGAFPRLSSGHGAWWLMLRGADDRAVLSRDGREVWRSSMTAGGNDPVCLSPDMCAWQRAGDNLIHVADLDTPAAQYARQAGAPTGLSHLDAKGRVVTVDEARVSVPGMTRPCWAGAVVVGEAPEGGILARHLATGREAVWFAGRETFCPRVAVDDDGVTYAALTFGRDGVRLVVFTLADLALPQPVPEPTPDPKPEPIPEVPMSLLETVKEVRRKYGATMSDDDCVALCNEVAWLHRDVGWGLSYKATGTHGTRHDGTPCCHDVVMLKASREGFDVLTAAGAASTPTWSSVGIISDPARYWVAPIAPAGVQPGPDPQPEPLPPPVTVTCKYLPVDYDLVRAVVRDEVAHTPIPQVPDVSGQLAALAARIEDINAELHAMVASQVQGLLAAISAKRT